MPIRKAFFALLVLGMFLLLVAINVQTGWLLTLVFTLFALMGINLIHPILSLRDIRAERVTGSAFEGEPVIVSISLSNPGRAAKYLINAIDRFPASQSALPPPAGRKTLFFPELPGGKSVTLTYQARADRRGRYTFPPLTLECSAPFGLVLWRRQLPIPTRLTVYPIPLPCRRTRPQHPQSAQTLSQVLLKAAGASEDFWGLREYAPGDSLRFVHWRTSAKERKLMIKEFRRGAGAHLSIFLDVSEAHHQGKGKDSSLECAIKIATALMEESIGQGSEVHLVTNNGIPPLRSGSRWQALEYLASLDSLETLRGAAEAEPHRPIGDMLVDLFDRERDLRHCVMVIPVDQEGVSPQLARILASLPRQRMEIQVVALLAQTFADPAAPGHPRPADREALDRMGTRAWWVARRPEGIRIL